VALLNSKATYQVDSLLSLYATARFI